MEYLDSAGLSVLLARAERIEIVASALLGPVLKVCGLTELTTVHGLEPEGEQPRAPVWFRVAEPGRVTAVSRRRLASPLRSAVRAG